MLTRNSPFYENNLRLIRQAALQDPVPVMRDIAWTLRYVQEAHPYACIETCILGLAMWARDKDISDYLPRMTRIFAHIHGDRKDELADWVNAQKEIATYAPIARTIRQ